MSRQQLQPSESQMSTSISEERILGVYSVDNRDESLQARWPMLAIMREPRGSKLSRAIQQVDALVVPKDQERNMSSTATVSIPYSEFQALQEAKRAAELETAQLKQVITETKIAASNEAMLIVARSALHIVRFAIASLPPESTKGWPSVELRSIASMLDAMPDASIDDRELAITISIFADECDRFEQRGRILGTR